LYLYLYLYLIALGGWVTCNKGGSGHLGLMPTCTYCLGWLCDRYKGGFGYLGLNTSRNASCGARQDGMDQSKMSVGGTKV
jgi:hypothetical protein